MEGAAKWRGGVYLLVHAAVYGPPLGRSRPLPE